MKKLFLIFFISFCLTSCWTSVKYKVNCKYQVCYPDTTITYNTIFDCSYIEDKFLENDTTFKVYTSSHRGTNYIVIHPGGNFVISTTSPIRLISFKKLQ